MFFSFILYEPICKKWLSNSNFFLAFEAANYIRPKHWYKDLWELDTENPDNNGLKNEDLVTNYLCNGWDVLHERDH